MTEPSVHVTMRLPSPMGGVVIEWEADLLLVTDHLAESGTVPLNARAQRPVELCAVTIHPAPPSATVL
jgi:hypothetical protein